MPERAELIASLNWSLFQIVRRYDSFRSVFARKHDINITELRAISRIVENPTMTPKQLAASLDLTTGAVTALVDRMVEGGLATRSSHPTDRRSLLLTPTDAASAVMRQLLDEFTEMLRRGTVDIGGDRLAALDELLAELVERGRAIPLE